jgi:hypothetical protein
MDPASFDGVRSELAANEVKAKSMLATWITSIKAGGSAVHSKPAIKEYNAKLYQKVRGLGTAAGTIPALKTKWAPVWGNSGFSSGTWINDATPPDEMKAKVKTILGKLSEFESEVK